MKRTIFTLLSFVLLLGYANAASWNVQMTWDPNSESDLAGYKVYENGVVIGECPAPNNSFTYTISTGAKRTWYVTAFDVAGNESGPSNQVSWDAAPTPCSSFSVIVTPQ